MLSKNGVMPVSLAAIAMAIVALVVAIAGAATASVTGHARSGGTGLPAVSLDRERPYAAAAHAPPASGQAGLPRPRTGRTRRPWPIAAPRSTALCPGLRDPGRSTRCPPGEPRTA